MRKGSGLKKRSETYRHTRRPLIASTAFWNKVIRQQLVTCDGCLCLKEFWSRCVVLVVVIFYSQTLHIPFVKIKSTCGAWCSQPPGRRPSGGDSSPGGQHSLLGRCCREPSYDATRALRRSQPWGHEPQTTMINVWPFFYFTVLWNRWDLLPIKSKSKLQTPPISSKYIDMLYGCTTT